MSTSVKVPWGSTITAQFFNTFFFLNLFWAGSAVSCIHYKIYFFQSQSDNKWLSLLHNCYLPFFDAVLCSCPLAIRPHLKSCHRRLAEHFNDASLLQTLSLTLSQRPSRRGQTRPQRLSGNIIVADNTLNTAWSRHQWPGCCHVQKNKTKNKRKTKKAVWLSFYDRIPLKEFLFFLRAQ